MDKPFKKLSLYLETSVWNFVYADDAPEKRDATKQLFDEIKTDRYDIYISDAVVFEIGNTRGPKKEDLEALIRNYNPASTQ